MLFCSSAYGQVIGKDSLLTVWKGLDARSLPFSEVQEFILNESLSLEQVSSIEQSILSKYSETQDEYFILLKDLGAAVCDLGHNDKCMDLANELIVLSKAQGRNDYFGYANLTLARFYFDSGDILQADKAMKNIKISLVGNPNPELQSSFYVERSLRFRENGKLDSALIYSDLAIDALSDLESKGGLSKVYVSRGRINRYLGLTDSAEVCYLKAEKYALEYGVDDVLPSVYNNLGNISHIKGRYDVAIAYYMKSIRLKEAKGDLKGLAIGYHNIGAIKSDMQAFDEAIEQFQKSDVLCDQIGFKRLNTLNATRIGSAYQMKNDPERALPYHLRALDVAREISFSKGESQALIALGADETMLGNMKLAKGYLLDALDIAVSTNSKSEECSALVALADWFVKLKESGDEQSNELSTDEIEGYLLRAKALSEEMNYGEKKLLVFDGLNRLYAQTGETDKKARLLQEYMEVKDSLYNSSRIEVLADWETKYATAEKEKEIIKLAADNEIAKFRTRMWQWLLVGAGILFALLGYFGWKYQRRINEQQQMEEAEKFRSRLSSDLHDDVGTMLSSLAMQSEVMGLTAKEGQVEKFEKLSHLSREAMSRMRDTVWAIDARKDKMEDLLDRMKDYLADILEGHILKAKFVHSMVDTDQQLRPDIRQNIYLIFKEAVNNAAKYSNGDTLTIQLEETSNGLLLSIHDNGVVDLTKIKSSGTGLSNLKMRAERIGGTLDLNTDDGFKVKLIIRV